MKEVNRMNSACMMRVVNAVVMRAKDMNSTVFTIWEYGVIFTMGGMCF